jgi:YbgC/YbaW family acyl-CoA thioester hydrolase
MAFRTRQPVRHPDVDRAGIVYFPRFYDFFHRALEDFFDQEVRLAFWDLEERLSVALPVVRIETDFDRPLQHGDLVTVELETLALGAHSVSLAYRVFRPGADEPASSSRIVLCCVAIPGWEKTPLPAEVRAAFERHRAA